VSSDVLATTPALPAPWTDRLWAPDPDGAARPAVLGAALAVGLLAALVLRVQVVGAGELVTGVALLAVALAGRGRRPAPAELVGVALAVALLAVGAVRAAPWLVALCLLAAAGLASLALAGGRTWTGVAVGSLAAALVPPRTARWVRRSLAGIRLPGLRSRRGWLVAVVTAGLFAVFGGLFVTADPAYAALLDSALPAVDVPGLLGRAVVLGTVTAGALVASYLAVRPPTADALAPQPGRPVRRWEWAVPLTVLDLLFLSFVVVQLAVLFGGREHVLSTRGLTYAEYARQGFWQLLAVTVLTLGVVAVAVRTGPRATTADRALVRVLLGSLCALALVVVASAFHRMSVYEQEYGFTRLRLLVHAVELALGAVLVLLLLAGVRLTGGWLPRAVACLGALTLLGLAAVDPDAWIAEHNVTRYAQTGRIDVDYLAALSADAVPALDRLPADLRGCALESLAYSLNESSDPWYDGNVARARARELLSDRPVGACRPAG
jgi:hypothetical protein